MKRVIATMVLGLLLAGCGSDEPDGNDKKSSSSSSDQKFPDIVEVEASDSGGTWTFEVTVSSPYDSPDRYADGWRVKDADGTVYGEHMLTHGHPNEQPFTRTQTGVEIPGDVTEVIVEGRDQQNGYGGDTQTVQLD